MSFFVMIQSYFIAACNLIIVYGMVCMYLDIRRKLKFGFIADVVATPIIIIHIFNLFFGYDTILISCFGFAGVVILYFTHHGNDVFCETTVVEKIEGKVVSTEIKREWSFLGGLFSMSIREISKGTSTLK